MAFFGVWDPDFQHLQYLPSGSTTHWFSFLAKEGLSEFSHCWSCFCNYQGIETKISPALSTAAMPKWTGFWPVRGSVFFDFFSRVIWDIRLSASSPTTVVLNDSKLLLRVLHKPFMRDNQLYSLIGVWLGWLKNWKALGHFRIFIIF